MRGGRFHADNTLCTFNSSNPKATGITLYTDQGSQYSPVCYSTVSVFPSQVVEEEYESMKSQYDLVCTELGDRTHDLTDAVSIISSLFHWFLWHIFLLFFSFFKFKFISNMKATVCRMNSTVCCMKATVCSMKATEF